MRLLTLGGLDIRRPDGAPVRGLHGNPKRLALLLYLALRPPGTFLRRASLLAVFWPESDDASARNSLRNALHYLRSRCGPELLVGRSQDEIGIDHRALWCDAIEFEQASRTGDHERALQLYRGPLLAGFVPPGDLSEFEDWLAGRRRALATMASAAGRALAERAAASNPAAAAHWAARWVEIAPYEEPAIRALMDGLARAGDRAGALGAFESWRERLSRELGVEPGPETEAAVAELRLDAPAPAASMTHGVADAHLSPATAPTAGPAAAPAAAEGHPRPRAVGRRHGRRRGGRHVVALGIGGVLALAVAGGGIRWAAGSPDHAPVVVAVLPFSYAGDPQYRYLGPGMVKLLTDQVERSPGLRAVDSRAVLAMALDGNARIPERV